MKGVILEAVKTAEEMTETEEAVIVEVILVVIQEEILEAVMGEELIAAVIQENPTVKAIQVKVQIQKAVMEEVQEKAHQIQVQILVILQIVEIQKVQNLILEKV